MSTRCTLRIINNEKDKEPICIYHHCDGYPEGVGKSLADFLRESKKNLLYWEKEVVANQILKGAVKCVGHEEDRDMKYEITCGQHGDEEYGYVINCGDKSLRCYELDWDVFEWDDNKSFLINTETNETN